MNTFIQFSIDIEKNIYISQIFILIPIPFYSAKNAYAYLKQTLLLG